MVKCTSAGPGGGKKRPKGCTPVIFLSGNFSWGPKAPSRDPPRHLLGSPGSLLGISWSSPGTSWASPGASLASPGPLLGPSGTFWACPGTSWALLGLSWDLSWHNFGPRSRHRGAPRGSWGLPWSSQEPN